ncbi:baseplate J/gp47 family protein [Mycobacteroides abscessus]|uniref:baseplate J/gp47 family protein n=1 Tax=Mycobacteroides abscessus TaxID=36809 RepID=UPI000C258FF1
MLDEKGFRKKTYSEIYEEIEQDAKSRFGQKINTSERSVFGILFRIFAWFLAVFWNIVEAVYFNSFPSTATGISLQRLVKFKGMSKILAAEAFGKIQITGTPNAIIPSGFLLSTSNGVFFETIDDLILDNMGVGEVEIRAIEKGSIGNVEIGEINEVVELSNDVESVTNLEPTAGGRESETDAELKKRFDDLTPSGGSSSESVEATLLEVAGVRDAIVRDNTLNEVSADGLPPKCIAPFVFGGTDTDVAKAIFSVKAGGIQSYGTTVVEVADTKGSIHLIGFTRPTVIDIFINVQLVTNSFFPADGNQKVRTSILKYIGGADETNYEYQGLGLKENVIHARIVAAVLSVQGVEDATVTMSIDNVSFSDENIVVSSEQVAKTSFDKVVIA